MCASIWLIFCLPIESIKVNITIKFGIGLFNIQGVTSNFTHKPKSNVCQAYRLNCFEEQAENRYVPRLNIKGVPFGG